MAPAGKLVSALVACTWVAFVGAQASLPTLPSCATSCYSTFEGDSPSANTTCSDLDLKCLCQDDGFLDSMICCLHESCSDSDREAAENYSRSLRKSIGVTFPSGLGCSANSTSSSSSATAKSTASSVASSTSNDGDSASTEGKGTSSDSNTGGGSSSDSSSGGSSSSNNHHSTNHDSKVGLGAGLGVGLPAAAAILGGFLYILRRKKQPPAAPTAGPTLANGINELPAGSNFPNFQAQLVGTYPHTELAAYRALEKKEDGQMGVTVASSPEHELASGNQLHIELPGHAPPPVHELPLTGWQQPELPGRTVPPVHELPLNPRLPHTEPGNQQQ